MHDSDSDKNDCYDSDGEYHEDYCSIKREEYIWDIEDAAYTNLTMDNRLSRMKEIYNGGDGRRPPDKIIDLMAEYGHLEMVKWAHEEVGLALTE